MRRHALYCVTSALSLLALVLIALPARGQELTEVLEQVRQQAQTVETVKCDLSLMVDLDMGAEGKVAVNGQGKLYYTKDLQLRLPFTLDIVGAGPEGTETANIKLFAVSDGTTGWLEVPMPAEAMAAAPAGQVPSVMVFKIDIATVKGMMEEAKANAEASGEVTPEMMVEPDVAAAMESLQEYFDLTVEQGEQSDEQEMITITGGPKEKLFEEMEIQMAGQGAMMSGMMFPMAPPSGGGDMGETAIITMVRALFGAIKVRVSAEDYLFRQVQLIDEDGKTWLDFGVKNLTVNADFRPTIFAYEEPPGVIDMTGLIQMSMQQAAGSSGEEWSPPEDAGDEEWEHEEELDESYE